MRDKLIHGYFSVDSERVWITIKRDLPPPQGDYKGDFEGDGMKTVNLKSYNNK